MLNKLLSKAFSVILRMNDWWDRDEDKQVASIISAIIILLGILVLKKPILFVVALILLANRVIHRFDLRDKWATHFDIESYDHTMNYDDTVPAEALDTGQSKDSIVEWEEKETDKEDDSKS